MSKINFFAKTNFRNQEVTFGIKEDDRRRHMYIIGKTGMGKSNMMENMAIQDIRNGEGVCYVDPHGEGAEKMLKAVPADRINDVIYFNPSDSEFPIAFNILESVDESKKNLVASGMMGVFKKIWPDVWSPRMEYILNNTILALLDYPGSTMLGVNRMMSDKEFRKRVYPKIKDPVVKSFWINEFDAWDDKFRKEAVAAIQNKVGQFLSSFVIRHIVGQPKSTIDMRDIMDNKKILIVNLSKGRIGEDAMRLLGGMIVTKIQLAAMGRVEIPEADRLDFYLYVDEFQNFATESFANILSEARKYKLCLILAHQYINQLVFDSNTTVRDAIFGNVGTMISFRVGADDAEHLEKEFEPVFLINDIVNLAKFHFYTKLMIDGIAGDAFSATALPPLNLLETQMNEEKIINNSRERYGSSKKEVEERIARWSGMAIGEDEDVIVHRMEPQAQKTPVVVVEKKRNQLAPIVVKAPVKKVYPIKKIEKPIEKEVEKTEEAPAIKETQEEKIVEAKPVLAEDKQADEPTRNASHSDVDREKPAKKEVYEAICDTCEQKIFVPFKPDNKRPAFCKECLKDYQRQMAKTKNQNPSSNSQNNVKVVEKVESEEKNEEEEVVSYKAKEKPMSLSQMSHIAPKNFSSQRKKPNINLEEVRNLLKKSNE